REIPADFDRPPWELDQILGPCNDWYPAVEGRAAFIALARLIHEEPEVAGRFRRYCRTGGRRAIGNRCCGIVPFHSPLKSRRQAEFSRPNGRQDQPGRCPIVPGSPTRTGRKAGRRPDRRMDRRVKRPGPSGGPAGEPVAAETPRGHSPRPFFWLVTAL